MQNIYRVNTLILLNKQLNCAQYDRVSTCIGTIQASVDQFTV